MEVTVFTAEQVLEMSLDQLLSTPFRDLQDVFQAERRSDDVRAHVETLLRPRVEPYLVGVREAFDKKLPLEDLVRRFENEPDPVQIEVWRQLTWHGIDQIDFCKFVHKHLANSVLKLFGTPGA